MVISKKKREIRDALFNVIRDQYGDEYDLSKTIFNRVWKKVDATGILDKLLEKEMIEDKDYTLTELEKMVSDDPKKNNWIALQMIKHSGFNRELVMKLYNGLGVEIHLGKEGAYGKGQVLKRQLNLQQFYTNENVSKLIAKMLSVPPTAKVFDPTCGSGRLFWHMPNPSMVHGIEYEGNAYDISKALYPNGQILQDDISLHMYDDAFDYVVANPPFTLWWEDRNFLYQNAKYGNRIISEMAVMEIGVRSLKQGGFLSIIMPSDVFEKKFINEKNFIAWLRKHANPVMKISLPSTTHEGTVWPTSLYIFQKNGHQSVNINVWWNEEQMIPPFKQYAQMDDFASDTITNIVNESNYDVGRHAIRYAEGIEPQSTFTLVHAEIKKLSAENYLTTSTDIKTNDVVTFDVSASNLETFDSIPIRLIPNGLHADLKTRSIKSRYPMEFSRAQRRYIDTFTEKIANLDELMDPRNPFEKKPLVQSIFSYDMDIGYSKRFGTAQGKRNAFMRLQDTPFEQWIDPNQDLNWSYLNQSLGFQVAHSKIWKKFENKFKKLQRDPKYNTYLPFLGKKGNWIKHLFDYQQFDAVRMAIKRSVINACGMGLGKTRTTIATAELKDLPHNLIVCKRKLIAEWFNEFKSLGMKPPYLIEYDDDIKPMMDNKYCIIPLSMLSKRSHKNRRPKGRQYEKNPRKPWNRVDDFDYDKKDGFELEDDIQQMAATMDLGYVEQFSDISLPFRNPRGRKEGELTKMEEDAVKLQRMDLWADHFAKKFDLVIVDEAHDLSNPTTLQSESVRRLHPRNIILMTGTPIKNRVNGLLSLLILGWGENTRANPYSKKTFLDHFEVWDTIEKEVVDSHGYRSTKKKRVRKPEINNPDDLRTLMAGKWLRRTQYEPAVAKNVKFPQPIINFIDVDITPEEREYQAQWYSEYERLKGEIRAVAEEVKFLKEQMDRGGLTESERKEYERLLKEKRVLLALAAIIIDKLRFISLYPQGNPFGKAKEDSALHKWLSIPNKYHGGTTYRQKMIIDEIAGRVKKGEQCYTVVEYPIFNRFLKKELSKHGVSSEIIDGSVPMDKRTKIINKFRQKKTDCILATIRTFDVGINIPDASYCAIVNPSWNWSDMHQAYSRMIRPQSKGTRTVDFFTLKNSIEMYVKQLFMMKRYNLDYVMDYGVKPPTHEWQGWEKTDAVDQMFADIKAGKMEA